MRYESSPFSYGVEGMREMGKWARNFSKDPSG